MKPVHLAYACSGRFRLTLKEGSLGRVDIIVLM